MNAQTNSIIESRQVVPRVAKARSRLGRKRPGLLASIGFAALFFLALPSTVLAQGYLGANLRPYAFLGSTTVTCAGGGLVTGDVGVSPSFLPSITGFPGLCPPPVAGVLVGAPGADAGQADLLIAYGILAAQVCDATVGPDLAGLTLTPGTYCVNAAASNLTGLLQLDAQGNPNAAWIFKMTTTLVTSGVGTSVVVINGGPANSCGAQWLVQTSATINTGTVFIGNILALTDITMNGNLTGRALAQTGQVTMSGGSASFVACGAGAGAGGAPPPFPVFGAGFAGGAGSIPTLSEWAMVMLAALLAIAGFAAMRRKAK